MKVGGLAIQEPAWLQAFSNGLEWATMLYKVQPQPAIMSPKTLSSYPLDTIYKGVHKPWIPKAYSKTREEGKFQPIPNKSIGEVFAKGAILGYSATIIGIFIQDILCATYKA